MISKLKLKSKICKIFKTHNPLEEYSVRIYKTDPYFYEHYERKIQVNNNGRKHMLFNTSSDLDYEIGNIHTFIHKFKNEKIKKLEKQLIKEKDRNKILLKNLKSY